MAILEELHVGDAGTEMRFRITDSGAAVDLSTASTLEITIISPGGTTFTVALVATTDLVLKTLLLGWCKFDLAATHTDAAGFIKFQAHIVDGSLDVKTSKASREVFVNL